MNQPERDPVHPVESPHSDSAAPKIWKGRFFEDLDPGDVFRSRLGRTISEVDNTWFTCLTMNTNQLHFNAEYAKNTRFERLLVNSCLTLSVVSGLSVPDTSENALANLSWTDIRLPNPVFVGDTLWSESEVLSKRESKSIDHAGLVTMRTRGLNQDGLTVIEFLRTFMIYKRGAVDPAGSFPRATQEWKVGTSS